MANTRANTRILSFCLQSKKKTINLTTNAEKNCTQIVNIFNLIETIRLEFCVRYLVYKRFIVSRRNSQIELSSSTSRLVGHRKRSKDGETCNFCDFVRNKFGLCGSWKWIYGRFHWRPWIKTASADHFLGHIYKKNYLKIHTKAVT